MKRRTNRARHGAHRTEMAHSHPVATAVAKQLMAEHMTTISISIYLMSDGEPPRDLLSHLGWIIGIGAEIAAVKTPGAAQAKRLHAALRTVIAMGETNAWQSSQAPTLSDAADEAKSLLIGNAGLASRLLPDAEWIAARIRDGIARLSDVAGAELYTSQPQQEGIPA